MTASGTPAAGYPMQSAAALSYQQRRQRPAGRAGSAALEIRSEAVPGARLAIYADLDAVEPLWREFERSANRTAFQSFDYLRAWFRHVGENEGWRPLIVVLHLADDVMAVLPLAVSGGPFLRRLAWLGQDLCDYLAPLFSDELARMPAAQFRALWREIGLLIRSDRRFRYDYVELRRMPAQIDDRDNPFTTLPAIRHASDGHLSRLGADWSEFYRERRSARARKQDRSKARRLAEFGGVRLFSPREPAEIARVLETMFAQKSGNFARKGIHDIFERAGYRAFFTELATGALTREWVHVSALQVGPSFAATSLALEHKGRYALLLVGYDQTFAQYSPGVLHLNLLIERAIGRGITELDFLVGEQRLKQEWADVIVPLHDHIAAASWRGYMVAPLLRAVSRLKRSIKQNRTLWSAFLSFRALRGAGR